MKRKDARILVCLVGCVAVAGSAPAFIHWFNGGKFTWNLHADYMDGLALIADWSGNYGAQKQFEDKAYQVREGVAPISFHCENTSEVAAVWTEIWTKASRVTKTVHGVADDYAGRLEFYVPREEAASLKAAGDKVLSAASIAHGPEAGPERPTPAQVAKILGIDESRVSADQRNQHPKLEGKVLWLATYKITGEQDCSVTITLFPNARIKTDFIEKIGANQSDFQKITRDDGDVIYHVLGDRGDQGTFYMTTLINHEKDWDMTLTLSREPSVDETKLPFAIAKDGIKLIGEFESLLRKPRAQQAGGGQPATRPESK